MTDSPEVVLARIDLNVKNLMTTGTDHETRIRRLEKFMWVWTGGGAAAGAVLGQAIPHLWRV